jgi:trans-aconitate methyltransferase
MNRKEHWNQVYKTKGQEDISWHQAKPAISLRLIEAAGVSKGEPIVDVGSGTSMLIDCLLDAEFNDLTVVDISGAALEQARKRLGPRATQVTWIEADVTAFNTPRPFRLWHDRAVFHFLTDSEDQRRYVLRLKGALPVGAQAVIGTFAIDGPDKCSGLPVARYDAESLQLVLGEGFRLVDQADETHVTPWQSEQRFSFFRVIRTE